MKRRNEVRRVGKGGKKKVILAKNDIAGLK